MAKSPQPMQSDQASPPAASPEYLDRSDPEAEIARAVRSYSNRGRWGADDVIAMPLRCSTQWDGLGHIFDHGKAWNGRDAARTVTSDGDLVTGIEQLARPMCGRGVLPDAGALREGWGNYAGGAAPGLSFTTAGWLHRTEVAAVATDTWGFEVRPNEFDNAFQPLHQVAIPHLGLLIGEMWALEELADDCAADGVYEFFLTAAPLPITGAAGSPVNPIAVK